MWGPSGPKEQLRIQRTVKEHQRELLEEAEAAREVNEARAARRAASGGGGAVGRRIALWAVVLLVIALAVVMWVITRR